MDSGIFVTEVGASVPTAADYQYVFNSNWPSLQCAYDAVVTLIPSGSVTLNHNLSFYPLVMGWVIQNGISLGRIFAPSGTFEESPQTDITMSWDKVSIYLTNSSGSNTYTVNVKAYNVDISQSVNYALSKYPPFKQPYDPTTGIKVTKYNKSISSTDLRDFILHSRAQSPAILAIVTGNTSVGTGVISYQNPANYIPWIFAFYTDSNGQYHGLAPGTQQIGALFKLGANLTFTSGSTTINVTNGAIMTSTLSQVNLSLVALRDPLVVSNQVESIYNG